MISAGYEFKVTQPDGVETVVKVPNPDLLLPDLMEHVEAFLVAAGFHQDTINEYFESNRVEGESL